MNSICEKACICLFVCFCVYACACACECWRQFFFANTVSVLFLSGGSPAFMCALKMMKIIVCTTLLLLRLD